MISVKDLRLNTDSFVVYYTNNPKFDIKNNFTYYDPQFFMLFIFLDKKSATSFREEPHLNWEQLNQIRVRQMVKWSIS